MKVLGIIMTAAALAVASPAQAQKIDLSTITCKEFQSYDTQTISLILMWMTGYYADQDAAAVIDLDKFKADAMKLGKYCSENPQIGIITAAEETISNE